MPSKLVSQIQVHKRTTTANLARALNAGARAHAVFSQLTCPVDTGFLRDNIEQTEEADEINLQATVESQADYSAYVEFGTSRASAQPFFLPGFEVGVENVKRDLKRK